jgi:excinuclease UvrABC ATPase subunit
MNITRIGFCTLPQWKDPAFADKLEKQVAKLMQDDDVERKSGIYSYVLDGDERHLNIRAFSDNMKREAYERQKGICVKCKTEIAPTEEMLMELGLGYLSLDRPSGTLSGGEAQRVKMIRHLGSSLTDVTYVFDEPTIGLHPHDIQRMNDLLLRLRDKGNTVLVVEHKPETIAIADHAVDLGPGAGTAGGEVVFEGTVDGLRASGALTGRHLDDRASLKPSVRTPSGVLEVRGANGWRWFRREAGLSSPLIPEPDLRP